MTPPIEKDLLEIISSIATLITPLLLAIIGGLGWMIQNKVITSQAKQKAENLRVKELEDKLREDRIETYNLLLEPFFLLFTSDEAAKMDPKFRNKNKNDVAITKMLSIEYRKIGFKLSLVATDSVLRAYNELMQFFYHTEQDPRTVEVKTSHWIELMATLLFEIRKSMGNEASEINKWEMIEWFMKDAKLMKKMNMDNAVN